jgi:molybdate transport system substrate-binding protein
VPRTSPLALERDGLRALLDPRVLKVAIANPAAAPYGVAAEEALRAAGVFEHVQPRLVLGQNAAQAAQFAHSGNAQAALLPLSLALAPPLAGDGRHVLVPASSHAPIVQAGVIPATARSPGLARAFADFLLGPEGGALLRRHGYGPPR